MVVPRTSPASFSKGKGRLDHRPQLITENSRANHRTHRDRTKVTDVVGPGLGRLHDAQPGDTRAGQRRDLIE